MIRRAFLKALCASPLGFLLPKIRPAKSLELRPVYWKHHTGGNLGAAWANDEYVYHITKNYGGSVIWERSKVHGDGWLEEVHRSDFVRIT